MATKGSIQLLAQALGQDVLTTSITSFLGIKGAFDHQTNTVVLDVTSGNRSAIVDTFGHEIAHGQGIKNETSADLIGKTVDWAFSSGIKSNQDTIDHYKVQLGDGKDVSTQVQNIVELEKDKPFVLDQAVIQIAAEEFMKVLIKWKDRDSIRKLFVETRDSWTEEELDRTVQYESNYIDPIIKVYQPVYDVVIQEFREEWISPLYRYEVYAVGDDIQVDVSYVSIHRT